MNHKHQTSGNGSLPGIFLCIAAAVLLFFCPAGAFERPRQGDDILRDAYQRHMSRLEANGFGMPLVLESSEQNDMVHVDVYGIFDYPFSSVAGVVSDPANWCDIVSLHPNVKACTSREQASAGLLTFYIGRKVYQAPEDARQVVYRYRNVDRQQGYLDVTLSADAGPFGTKDHKMRFEALALDRGRTFVRVSYAYRDSAALRLAARAYFATIGSGKVGFTVTGTDSSGKPVFVGGPRGAIERNAVRYYLAIQSYMDTLRYPEEKRFGMRISEWYDLTSRYRKQLFELDRKDYLSFKTKEHMHQVTLQTAAR